MAAGAAAAPNAASCFTDPKTESRSRNTYSKHNTAASGARFGLISTASPDRKPAPAALAVLVFGMFIVLAGYEAGVTVTPEMQWTVFASLTLVPAASCLASAIPFVFYRLGR